MSKGRLEIMFQHLIGTPKGDGGVWTVNDVRKLIINPVYAGVGEYPAIISDELWLSGNVALLREIGPRRFLKLLLEVSRETAEGDEIYDHIGAPYRGDTHTS